MSDNELITFTYNNIVYNYVYNKQDPSGKGCITEIVNRDEYVLSKFSNIENGHFIDIGANSGVATIILAKQNPKSIVYSFEPHLETFKLLESNVKVNKLTNVKLFNMGVSNKTTKNLTLTTHPLWSGGNTTYADKAAFESYHGSKNVVRTTVSTIGLDEIMNIHEIDKIHLLKIDCEGAEYDILYDSDYFKNNRIMNMVGEFHNLRYNSVDNNNEKLLDYSKKYVNGIIKITMLTL